MGCNMEATRGTNEPVSGELVSVAHALSLPAESYGNDPDIEMAWAMRAMQHAEVYYKLISSVDPQFLKLTKVDDQIYSEFRENFERLRVDVLDPEELKSEAAKEKWRPFCLKFDGIIEDFNYGTLLRLDCSQGYTEENTIFAPRIQFFAIEIARNREGYNKAVYTSVQDKEEKGADSGGEEKGAKMEGEKEKTNKGGKEEAKKEIKSVFQMNPVNQTGKHNNLKIRSVLLLLDPETKLSQWKYRPLPQECYQTGRKKYLLGLHKQAKSF
ncbi:protein PBDC1 isoform X4 [Manis pentadactyla]|uniref:protein PBDC1 isoform X4 n=1 Tax=Manis pentadactyla TaxID=143292 RepID=UPI00255C8FCD|nr:protein PBDC1 isoform X4 [Manis pentadactyla]